MRQLFCVLSSALLQAVLGLESVPTSEFCDKLRLLATNLDLLVIQSSEKPAVPEVKSTLCNLLWDEKKIVPKDFELDVSKHYSKIRANNDATLREEEIEGRTLLMPDYVVNNSRLNTLLLNLNGHVFLLVGGLFEQRQEPAAFIYDQKERAVVQLITEDQRDQLSFHVKTEKGPHTQYGNCINEGYLQQDQRYLLGIKKLHQQKRTGYCPFKLLLYRDVGPISIVADFGSIPVHAQRLDVHKICLPKDELFKGHHFPQLFLAEESVLLIRLLQLIKYIQARLGLSIAFETDSIKMISQSIDIYDNSLSQRDFFETILLEGIAFITNPMFPSSFEALVCREPEIAKLFLRPDPKAASSSLFDSFFGFDEQTFDNSIKDLLLPYKVSHGHIPATLRLRIGANEFINLAIFAFIDSNGVLYLFEESATHATVVIHGCYGVETVVLESNLNRGDMPALTLSGSGLAFYRKPHFQPQRTKGSHTAAVHRPKHGDA